MSDPAKPPGAEGRNPTGSGSDFQQARNDLRGATQEAREAAGEAASTVAAEASAAASTVKQEGAALLDTARRRAEDMATETQHASAEQAQGFARAIHRAADELRQESPQLSSVIHDAAGSVDRIASALRDRSPREMLHTAEDWARRQPLAFFGAAALAGFALARFARSSAQHNHDMRTAGTSSTGSIAGGSMADAPSAGMGVGPGGAAFPNTGSTERDTATTAPGWVQGPSDTPRPATLASASLGGAASYRPRGGDNG